MRVISGFPRRLSADRIQLAMGLQGWAVVLDTPCGGIPGELMLACSMLSGTTNDVVVVRRRDRGGQLLALTGASISRIEVRD